MTFILWLVFLCGHNKKKLKKNDARTHTHIYIFFLFFIFFRRWGSRVWWWRWDEPREGKLIFHTRYNLWTFFSTLKALHSSPVFIMVYITKKYWLCHCYCLYSLDTQRRKERKYLFSFGIFSSCDDNAGAKEVCEGGGANRKRWDVVEKGAEGKGVCVVLKWQCGMNGRMIYAKSVEEMNISRGFSPLMCFLQKRKW